MVLTLLFLKLCSPHPHGADFIISPSYFQLLVQHIKSSLLDFVMSFDPASPSYVQYSLVFCVIKASSFITRSPGVISWKGISPGISLFLFWLPDVEVLCNKTQASQINSEFSASPMAGLHMSPNMSLPPPKCTLITRIQSKQCIICGCMDVLWPHLPTASGELVLVPLQA